MMDIASLRYALVAGLSLLIHNVIIIAADALEIPLLCGVLLSFSVVVVGGYLLHSRLTFREPVSWQRFNLYALAMMINIPASFATIWVWNIAMGLPMVWASPIATVCMVSFNFLLSRWAIITSAKIRE